VLLDDRLVRPPPGTVELDHDRLVVLDPDLIDTVLVTAKRQDPAVAQETAGLDRVDDRVRSEPVERMSGLCAAPDPDSAHRPTPR